MKKFLSSFLLCSFVLLVSCQKESTPSAEIKPVPLTEKQQAVVQQSNSFGFEFFKKAYSYSGCEKNFMVSPLSVSMAFGMARNGASNQTLEQMTEALGMSGMTDQEVNSSYKYILETFSNLDPKVRLSIANSIWYRNTFSVEQDFLSTNHDYFQAELEALDFNDPGSVDVINNWVSNKTNALIPKIISSISADMVMYLINAVYFKGQWKYNFEKSNTRDDVFMMEDGSTVSTPFMSQKASFKYYSNELFKGIELPYNQGNYNMVVLLPESGKGVNDVITGLSQENWKTWYRKFGNAEVSLKLPKFKFAYEEKKMVPVMAEMGMPDAFNPDLADFSRIHAGGGIYISEVKHKTFIETNEEGTEAAAVTSIGFETTSVGPKELEFIADKPFVFFIHEKQSGCILFIGTVMNPTQE